MDITDLTLDEQLILVGLAKIIVRADQEVSPEEHATLKSWATTLGSERWGAIITQASERFHRRSDVLALAGALERQEARNLIYGRLYQMAHSDELVVSEARFLSELSEMWEIAEQVL